MELITLHNNENIPSNLFCVVDTNIIEISIINITHVEPNEDDLGFSIAETKPTNTELTTNVSDLYNHYYPKLFIRNKRDLGGLVFTDLNSAKQHVINNIKSQINIKQNEIDNLNKILQELNS